MSERKVVKLTDTKKSDHDQRKGESARSYALRVLKELKFGVKLNLTTNRIEVRFKDGDVVNPSEGLALQGIAHYVNDNWPALPPSDDCLEKAIHGLAFNDKYDPCRDYYIALEPLPLEHGDNYPRAIEVLYTTNKADRAAWDGFLDQIVRRMNCPGCEAPHMLILKGKQGLLKTAIARAMGLGWFSQDNLVGSRKEAIRKISTALINEVDELNWRRMANERVKSMISSLDDYLDEKYLRGMPVPRRCLFVATTNTQTPLPHDVEGRRFWIIETKPNPAFGEILNMEKGLEKRKRQGELMKQFVEAYQQDLRRAKHRVEKWGAQGELDSKERAEMEERFQANTFRDDEIENWLSLYGEAVLGMCDQWDTIKPDEFREKLLGKINPARDITSESTRVNLEQDVRRQLKKAAMSEVASWLQDKGYKYTRTYINKRRVRAWVRDTGTQVDTSHVPQQP